MAGDPTLPAPRTIRFGPFELDVRAAELRKHGIRVRLNEQPFRILLMLLNQPGEVVLRDEIRHALWPNNTVVEFDHSINAAIKRLRDALSDSADMPRYVETLARRGYRFIGNVEPLEPAEPGHSQDPKPLPQVPDVLIAPDQPEPASSAVFLGASKTRWVVAAVALAIAATLAVASRPRPVNPGSLPAVSRFVIPLPPGAAWPFPGFVATQWVPSPDGRNLAMVLTDIASGRNALWVRALDGVEAHHFDHTESANFPFWSPDGRYIAFFADGKLKRLALAGGAVQTICDVPNASPRFPGDGGAWNSEGVIVFAAAPGPLMRVSATGGKATSATILGKDERSHLWPQFLPDGRHLLYLAASDDPSVRSAFIQEWGTPRRTRVLSSLTRVMWSPPGYLLFLREGTLYAQAANSKTFQPEGEPVAIARDVAFNETNTRSSFSVSENGVLAYRTRAFSTRQLLWRRRDGSTAGLVGKPGEYSDPVLSPDGRSVAIQVGVASPEVWVRDLVTGVMTNIHIRPAPGGVSWSPDSTRLAVTSGNRGIVGISLASGKAVPLTDEPVVNGQWLPDGRTIFCTAANRRRLDLLTLDGSPKLRTIMEIPNRMEDPRVSPDGRYVAYLSIDSSGLEAYVSSFPTFAAKRKISSGGARSVVWAKSGKELFYQSEDGTMNAVDLRAGDAIETGTPRPLFKFSTAPGINRFDVAADGRFLIAENVQKDETDRPEIILVLNWTAAMRP